MNRYSTGRSIPNVPKKEKIEINHKNAKIRLIFVVLLFIVGIFFIGRGIYASLSGTKGWQEISSTNKLDNSDEIKFYYYFDTDKTLREAKSLYSKTILNSYMELNEYSEFDNVNNIMTINTHPNEDVVVSDWLYSKLEKVVSTNSKYLYTQPIYQLYDGLFNLSDGEDPSDLYPEANTEYFNNVLTYINNNEIKLNLKGNNVVCLEISSNYKNYLDSQYYSQYIGFGALKNAIVVDDIIDTFNNEGFHNGYVTTLDGYFRMLNSTSVLTNVVSQLYNKTVYQVGTFEINKSISSVTYKNYITNTLEEKFIYVGKDRIVTNKINLENGISQECVNYMQVYSDSLSCLEIAISTQKIYTNSVLDLSKLDSNIEIVYCDNNEVYYSESNISFKDLYTDENVTFVTKLIED